MASKKKSKDEKSRGKHSNPYDIEEHSDEERLSCLPWKRGRQRQAIIDRLNINNERIQRERDGLECERDDLKRERDDLKRERDDLKRERDGMKRDGDDLKRERDDLKRERDDLKRERDGLKRERDGLKRERDGLKRDGDDLKKEGDDLKSERDDLKKKADYWGKQAGRCQAQLTDYKHRLSEMVSERMRQGNACVEDLNDPFRPTALSDKWTGLFKTGEYWTAYDKAQKALKSEEDAAQFLYNVTRTVWKVCFDFVEDFVPRVLVVGPCSSDLLSTENEKELRWQMLEKLPEVRRKLAELLPQDASRVDDIVKTLKEEYNSVRQTDIPNLQQKLRKAVCLLPKTASPPALLAKKVADALRAEGSLRKDAQVDENFIRKLSGLCYLMRLQEVPLFVNFDFTRGSPLDPSMFEVENSALQPPIGTAIKSILRPPLLRSEGGAVLSKGDVDVEPA